MLASCACGDWLKPDLQFWKSRASSPQFVAVELNPSAQWLLQTLFVVSFEWCVLYMYSSPFIHIQYSCYCSLVFFHVLVAHCVKKNNYFFFFQNFPLCQPTCTTVLRIAVSFPHIFLFSQRNVSIDLFTCTAYIPYTGKFSHH